LAAVQDLFSRRIVGWAMDRHMREEIVVDALEMAVAARRPAKGTIHHSDHGGQVRRVGAARRTPSKPACRQPPGCSVPHEP